VRRNLWIKCPDTGQLVFYKDVEANQFVIPVSNYHMPHGRDGAPQIGVRRRTWIDNAIPEVPSDPLKFRMSGAYADRLRDARAKTGQKGRDPGSGSASSTAFRLSSGVQDFDFMGGSLGMAAGEAITRAADGRAKKTRRSSVCGIAARACRRASWSADADAPDTIAVQTCGGAQTLCRGADQSDYRRRHRLVRYVGRYTYC